MWLCPIVPSSNLWIGIQIQLLDGQRHSGNNLILYVAINVSIYDGLLESYNV